MLSMPTKKKKFIGYIDFTPTWQSLLQPLMDLYQQGITAQARTEAYAELRYMAKVADQALLHQKRLEAINEAAHDFDQLGESGDNRFETLLRMTYASNKGELRELLEEARFRAQDFAARNATFPRNFTKKKKR